MTAVGHCAAFTKHSRTLFHAKLCDICLASHTNPTAAARARATPCRILTTQTGSE